MKIICIASTFPYPMDLGGQVRIVSHLRALAERHDVLLLTCERPDTDAATVAALRDDLSLAVRTFHAFGDRGSLRGWYRALELRCPPYVAVQVSDELRLALALEALRSDVVVALDDYAGAYFSALPLDAGTVLDKHRILAPEWVARFPRTPGAVSDRLLASFERDTIQRASAVVVTSDAEYEKLHERHQPASSAMVPSEPTPLSVERAPDGKTIAWLGAHEYVPNREGLEQFLDQGWDHVGQDARLVVAGKGATPGLQRRAAGREDIHVLGFVEDLQAFMVAPVAAVVPLWAGGGVKLKTVTFMEAGVPVVATASAVEGLDVEDGHHAIVAETPEALAAGLRRLLAEPELAARIGRAGQDLVRARRAEGAGPPAFVEVIERVGLGRGAT